MIFTSFSLKYPLGFHQLLVLAGDCGIRKNEQSPTKTVAQLVGETSAQMLLILTSECAPTKTISNVLMRDVISGQDEQRTINGAVTHSIRNNHRQPS